MFYHSFLILYILALLHLSSAFRDGEPSPVQLVTSQNHYGPDGPWQAVKIWLGSQKTELDLYPGGTYGSPILSNTLCDDVKAYPCGSGGLYNPSTSILSDDTSIKLQMKDDHLSWPLGAVKYRGHQSYIMDQLIITASGSPSEIKVPNLSILLVSDASMIYPDGSNYPLQLGTLSLGGWAVNQTFIYYNSVNNRPPVNASLLPGYLWEQNLIPSSSFGMHLGSATFGPPLSLWLGGYDRSRIVGPVSVQSLNNWDPQIDLLDIGIYVDHGASPFSFGSRAQILAEGNSSIGRSIPLQMNPNAPYLALPNSTCTAIAKNLPVTYSPKYGLYFWNVNDPLYKRIVTSPSYLSFTFRAAGLDTSNITIKVPFQLLNLTLESPLVTTPTQYFPCQPPQDTSSWSLGRAFLQSAFFGIDWGDGPGKWYLAQAPGPNTVSNPNQSPFSSSSSVTPSPGISWNETWTGSWFPLASTTSTSTSATSTSTSTNTSPSSQPAVKRGLKAWMIVLLVIGIIGGIPLLGFIFYRWCHRDQKSETPNSLNEVLSPTPFHVVAEIPNLAASDPQHRVIAELVGANFSEIPNGREFHEVGNHELGNHELGNHELGNHELGNHELGNHELGTAP